MRDWFKARNLWGAAIQTLSDEEAGRLMKAIWGYTMTGEPQMLSGPEKGIFALIMLTLSQDEEKDAEISVKRAEAGAKGGKQKVANATFATTVLAKEANASNKNKNIDIDKENKERNIKERKRFTPPTVEEVAEYCKERGNSVDPEMFVNFYESKGWMVGKSPMKDWKACIHTWEKGKRDSPKKVIAQSYEQRDYRNVQDDLMEQQRKRILERLNQEQRGISP